MPEAPELEVVKDFLNTNVASAGIVAGKVLKPSVLRPLAGDFATDVVGRTIDVVARRGKFLSIRLSGDRQIVINPMLTGAFQYCGPPQRVFKRTCIIPALSNDRQLRYVDDRQMGRVYFVRGDQLAEVPQLADQGPDALEETSFEEFQERLRRFYGEIKGVLTRGRVVSGIGNAYADEVLFAAKVYPFRKRRDLSQDELMRVHRACRSVVEEATAVVGQRMGDDIHLKFRDFLKVHNRGGMPCPRCGNKITQITANQRVTSYCRRCQPGMLIRS